MGGVETWRARGGRALRLRCGRRVVLSGMGSEPMRNPSTPPSEQCDREGAFGDAIRVTG